MATVIQELLRRSKLNTAEDIERWEELRLTAFEKAQNVYDDRAGSYNIDHAPTDEMVYGPISLASEMYKRMKRMTGILTPLREDNLSDEDLQRLLDTCIDLMNYASWQYAMVKLAIISLEMDVQEEEPHHG